MCGVCSDDFSFRSSTQKCEACSGSASLDAVTILFIIVAILIGAVASFVYSKPEFRQQVKTTDDFYVLVFIKLGLLSNMPGKFSNQHYENASVLRMRFMARLKFYILLWQVVALLPFTLDMNFPNVYSAIASVLNVFNLGVDVSSLVSCQSDTSFDAIDNLFFQTMYPIVVSGVLFFARSIHLYLRRGLDADILSQIGSRYFNIFILFMYLILPIVSIAIFQTFSCQDVDPDNIESGADRYMNVDYSVSCSSSKYQFGFTWAIVSIFVYPIGVPLLYFYILYSSKHDISTRLLPLSPPETASRRARLMSKKLLFEFYEPRFWFWEVVETIHRLLLTGVLVVIGQGTGAQIIVGFTVALLFLKLIDIFRPYVDSHVQHVRVMCQWQIYFVFFLALILKADFQSVDRGAVDALLALTITANIIMDVMFVATHLPQRTIKTSEKDYLRDGADDSNSSLGPDSEHTFNPLAEILTAPGESILSERKEDDQSWYKEKAIAMSDFHSCGGGCSSINTGV